MKFYRQRGTMRKQASTYLEIHGSRPSFARSLGTRSKLDAAGLQACSDQALAFAISSAGGSGMRQQIANEIAVSNRQQGENRTAQEHAALSGSLLLSLAGSGAHDLEEMVERSRTRNASPSQVSRRQSFHSAQSRDSLEMTNDSLSENGDHHVDCHPEIDHALMKSTTPSKRLTYEARPGGRGGGGGGGAGTASLAHQDAVQQILHGAASKQQHAKNASQSRERSHFLLPEPPSPVFPATLPPAPRTPPHDSSWFESTPQGAEVAR